MSSQLLRRPFAHTLLRVSAFPMVGTSEEAVPLPKSVDAKIIML
jgi:hypothetical protein